MKFYKFLNESITKDNLDKWKKDAQSFTKNIRRIKSGKEYYQVFKAWKVFLKNFNRFVFRNMLDSEDIKMIGNKEWPLIEYSILPKEFSVDDNYEIAKDIMKFDEYSERWNDLYLTLSENRNRMYNRLSKDIRETFNILYDHLEMIGGELDEKWIKSYETIDGVRITYIHEENQDVYKFRKKFSREIKNTFRLLKKKDFGHLLSNLKIYVISSREFLMKNTAGLYRYEKDIVHIYPDFDIKTIIHEIGHRQYFQIMDMNSTIKWNEFIIDKKILITSEWLDNIKSLFIKHFDDMIINDKFYFNRIGRLEKYTNDRYLSNIISVIDNYFRKSIEKVDADITNNWNMLVEKLEYKMINFPYISQYFQNVNEEKKAIEAFAEVFANYVLNNKEWKIMPEIFKYKFLSVINHA